VLCKRLGPPEKLGPRLSQIRRGPLAGPPHDCGADVPAPLRVEDRRAVPVWKAFDGLLDERRATPVPEFR